MMFGADDIIVILIVCITVITCVFIWRTTK